MATTDLDVAETIVELERAALERWGRGDPEGFLEISAPDLSYFDPFVESRLDGLPAMRSLYDQLRGKIHIDRFELVEPRVQVASDVAVLTFRFRSYSDGSTIDWNTTEVYQRGEAGWRIIHTHWAFHQPQLAS